MMFRSKIDINCVTRDVSYTEQINNQIQIKILIYSNYNSEFQNLHHFHVNIIVIKCEMRSICKDHRHYGNDSMVAIIVFKSVVITFESTFNKKDYYHHINLLRHPQRCISTWCTASNVFPLLWYLCSPTCFCQIKRER